MSDSANSCRRRSFGLAGITSSFGRVIFGFIADRLSKQAAYTLNIAMTVVGVGALMTLSDPSQAWLLYVYVIFFGIGFGSRAVIFSALTADIFSGKGFGSILGYSTVAVGVGGALGSWLGGAFYDWTGQLSWFPSAFGVGAVDFGYLHLARRGACRGRLRQAALGEPRKVVLAAPLVSCLEASAEKLLA